MGRAIRIAFGAAVLAMFGLGVWLLVRPASSLDLRRLEELTTSGRYDQAEELLEAYLSRRPGDPLANFLLGRLIVERPDQPKEPTAADAWSWRALEHLDRSNPDMIGRDKRALWSLARGEALFALRYYDAAELEFATALEVDPKVPEAGWALLDIYYLEERNQEAHDLALRLHAIEPDRRDRVQLLLELTREDVQPPDPGSLVDLFEPIARERPGELRPRVRLGVSMVRKNRTDEGLTLLRALVEERPTDVLAWDGLLTGLDLASRPDLFLSAIDQLPSELADHPDLAEHRGRAAQERGDWAKAVEFYREARRRKPTSRNLVYRLGRALKFAGRDEEGNQLLAMSAASGDAARELPALYQEANDNTTLGYRPEPDLYLRIADARRRMMRPDEARAWLRLVLETRPGDPAATSAMADLDAQTPTDG